MKSNNKKLNRSPNSSHPNPPWTTSVPSSGHTLSTVHLSSRLFCWFRTLFWRRWKRNMWTFTRLSSSILLLSIIRYQRRLSLQGLSTGLRSYVSVSFSICTRKWTTFNSWNVSSTWPWRRYKTQATTLLSNSKSGKILSRPLKSKLKKYNMSTSWESWVCWSTHP